APTGGTGLLYTNASDVEHLTILSITLSPTYRVVKLYSPVLSVFATDDAQYAVVVHDPTPSTTSHPGAFSVVPIGVDLPARMGGTDAPITGVALAPSSDRAVIIERGDQNRVYGAYVAKMPSLAYDFYSLASPPLAAGIVAGAHRAYIA